MMIYYRNLWYCHAAAARARMWAELGAALAPLLGRPSRLGRYEHVPGSLASHTGTLQLRPTRMELRL